MSASKEVIRATGYLYGRAILIRARLGEMSNDAFYAAACDAFAKLGEIDLEAKNNCIAEAVDAVSKAKNEQAPQRVYVNGHLRGRAMTLRIDHKGLSNDVFFCTVSLALGVLSDDYPKLAAVCIDDAVRTTSEQKIAADNSEQAA